MTQHTSEPTSQVARGEAQRVGGTTADAGRQVADTTREQAGEVAEHARREARDLFQEARGQLTEQARGGQQKAGETLRALAAELHEMAGGDRHGPASDLAAQAAGRVDGLADWLDRREPGDLVQEVRSFARRRPGVFLAGAALAGVLAGRLTRGAVDANRDTSGSGADGQQQPQLARPYAPQPTPMPYDRPGGALPPQGPLDAPGPGGPGGGALPPVPPGPGFPGPGGPGARPPAGYPGQHVPGGVPVPPAPVGDLPPGGYEPADVPGYTSEPPPGYPARTAGQEWAGSDADVTVPGDAGPPRHQLRDEGVTVGEYVEELQHGDTVHRPGPDGPR
jgi:hypothetical protein